MPLRVYFQYVFLQQTCIKWIVLIGYTDELTALEELVSNKQRSVNETFMRQTVRVFSVLRV